MLSNRKLRNLTRFNLGAFALLFLLFWLNVLLGKAKISFGWQIPFLLGDIAEFLLLLATALFFTLAAIGRETMVNRNQGAADPASGKVNS
jgi:apolipoprotein N-acyltransferase